MAQSVKCMPCSHEGLDRLPITHIEEEAVAGRSLGLIGQLA